MLRWSWLGYFFIFALTFITFLYILNPPGIIGPDSFYHTKMALMIKEQGLIQDFPWLQFTTYKDLFVDHHFGYHYLLIPFLSMPTPKNLDIFSAEIDPLIKAKIATAFFAAMALLIIYWLLRRLGVKAPLFWTAILLLASNLITRLSLIRAPAISIIILTLGFYFIIKKKYTSLFILSFIYVWTYGAWPLMLIVVLIYCISEAIRLTITHRQSIYDFFKNLFIITNIKLFSACISGLAAGLIINPYFPKTFPFYWFQTVKIAALGYKNKIGVGAEWYSPEITQLFINILPILIFWVIAIAWLITTFKKQKTYVWFFLFVSVFFLLYTLKSYRNVEYFIPTGMIFSAIIFTQIIEKINWNNVKNQFVGHLKGAENKFYFLTSIFLIFFIGFFIVFYVNLSIGNARDLRENQKIPISHLQMASYWLKNNTQPQDIVFQSNWDIFPQLFYFNSSNYYINGLDQTFMYEKDKDLYKTWKDLVSNKTDPNETAGILKQKFNASYVLVDKNHENFAKLIKKSSNLEKKYEDRESIIYKNLWR